jgi:hypothetical protein
MGSRIGEIVRDWTGEERESVGRREEEGREEEGVKEEEMSVPAGWIHSHSAEGEEGDALCGQIGFNQNGTKERERNQDSRHLCC